MLARLGQPATIGGTCACHSTQADCCPDRLRGVIDAGATRIGLHAIGGAATSVAGLIDHTLLKPEATREDVAALVAEGVELGVFSVCVSPSMLPLDARGLAVATVCGFPSGKHHSDVKAAEAARAVADGADEVDMVIDVGAARARRGCHGAVAVREPAPLSRLIRHGERDRDG